MLRNAYRCLFPCALLVVAAEASAQNAATPILSAYCNTLKPGASGEMMRNETAWARAFERLPGAPNMLGMVNVTGNSAACWLTAYPSMAAMGEFRKIAGPVEARFEPATKSYAQDARATLAVLRPDLSYGEAKPLEKTMLTWNTYRLRPGSDMQLTAAVKALAAARTRAGLKNDFRVYQVIRGAAGDTYWAMSGEDDLAALDGVMAGDAKMNAAFTADDMKVFMAFFDRVASTSSDIWAFNSAISTIKPADRATNAFWKLPTTTAGK